MTTFDWLLQNNFLRTPEGRYFLPFSQTTAGQQLGRPGYDQTEGSDPYAGKYFMREPVEGQQQWYDSPEGLYRALTGNQIAVADPGLQNVINLDTRRLSQEGIGDQGLRGTYNNEPGWYLPDLSYLRGFNPPRVGGKPNESGLWQALSIIAPAVPALYGAAAAGAGAGSAAVEYGAGESAAYGAQDAAYQNSLQTGTTAGGTTENYFDDYLVDPETGDVSINYRNADPYGTGVDQFGNPTNEYAKSTFAADTANTGFSYDFPSGNNINWEDVVKKYGIEAARRLYSAYQQQNATKRQSAGRNILDQIIDDPLSSLLNASPALLGYLLAEKQRKDLGGTFSELNALNTEIAGNASPYMKAITDPFDLETGMGRASVLRDQAARGVRGSSFGDQSLSNYDYMRGLGRADLGSRALLASADARRNILDTIMRGKTASNLAYNSVLGAGLGASGRLFQPEKDPFNLLSLFGLSGTSLNEKDPFNLRALG